MAIGKLFGVFHISGTGLSAQRRNLEVRAENIANAESVDINTGKPYAPKEIQFNSIDNTKDFTESLMKSQINIRKGTDEHLAGLRPVTSEKEKSRGVQAVEYRDNDPQTKLIYAPEHPHANEEGYLEVADVDTLEEMVKLMSAARAYEANATVLNAAKEMFKKGLEI